MALSAYVAQSAHVALSADGALSAPPTGANHWHFTECHRLRVARGCFTPTKVRSAKHPHTTQALPTRTSRLVWGHVCIPKGIIIKKVKFPDYLILRKVSQGNGALGRRIYGRVIEYTDKAKHGTKALMCRILVYYSVINSSIGSAESSNPPKSMTQKIRQILRRTLLGKMVLCSRDISNHTKVP